MKASEIMFLLAADLTLALHLLFIAFASCGALLAGKWRWIPLLQLPAAAWGIFIEFSGDICPLTHVENYFLVRAGKTAYQGDCIGHYLLSAIYPEGLTRTIQYLLAVVVLGINVSAYAWLLHRWKQASRHGSPL